MGSESPAFESGQVGGGGGASAKDRDGIWYACYWTGENAVSTDAQRKKMGHNHWDIAHQDLRTYIMMNDDHIWHLKIYLDFQSNWDLKLYPR